jgi:NADH-quinone oxidoreductase subunit L
VVNQHKYHCTLWLPDAMAGPISIDTRCDHGNCGYLYDYKIEFYFDLAPDVQNIIAIVGAVTLVAATIALVQTDIKKVLAYSTVSQLDCFSL